MQRVNEEILDSFRAKTRFSIRRSFFKILAFLESDYPIVQKYYNGEVKEVPRYELRELESVRDEIESLYDVIEQNVESLNNTKYLSLIKQIEDLDRVISNIENVSKWLRSSSFNGEFSNDVQVSYTLNQNETVEHFSFDSLSQGDYQDSWYRIAINNKLLEKDYGLEGGQILTVSFPNTNLSVESVVDLIEGDSIYGVDIHRDFKWENEDLKTVSGKDCLLQSAANLLGLKKGDNPDDFSQGLDRKVAAGVNINSINFPIILRQLTNVFATDDTISSFSLVDVSRDQDSLSMSFNIVGRAGDKNTLSLDT